MYEYKIKGHVLQVVKVVYDSGLIQWYFDVDNSGNVNDHYFYKRTAKAAGIEFINNLYK